MKYLDIKAAATNNLCLSSCYTVRRGIHGSNSLKFVKHVVQGSVHMAMAEYEGRSPAGNRLLKYGGWISESIKASSFRRT